ncbi:MAG: chromosome partitioning protein ParA [Gammaproteobacteria bacterium]|jgi:chromosome partitioning protein|nr:chromosome partitioning protein ParA [Gammaproteobacteria bacterium]HCV03225.1 chromosome partitioning protein ParA [Pseudoalteromonas sp.]MBK82352.1 chromosome partitioning protein ParA [Gammaproteobacteria bacterium]MBK82375.1 chromosome partitioning protein ParA [Gammaproteobacteria bacterium]MBK83543.1 chromosome partitioning protein ParA [Gammaproteobacteria bacterium]|tara:strand:+ start:73 stop:738 length:666 start_codon:yes stop_codon:yes gene_type:complete
MGHVILVGGQKGGPGKSTIAQNLAGFFLLEQNNDVLLLDADAQGTTSDWLSERNKNTKRVKDIIGAKASGDIERTIIDFKNRFEIVVIDTGGLDSEELRSAMTVADVCLFPFRPKRRDIKTLEKVTELISLLKRINPQCLCFSIMSQCPSQLNQKYRIDSAKACCEEFGLPPFENVTEIRNVYDDCDEGGMTVLEQADAKAKMEMISIGNELIDRGLLRNE